MLLVNQISTSKISKVASEKRQEEMEMKTALEEQISQHREQHQKQVSPNHVYH